MILLAAALLCFGAALVKCGCRQEIAAVLITGEL